jgi:hypothetical protein
MKPFIVTTTKFSGLKPVFNKKQLNVTQKRLLDSFVRELTASAKEQYKQSKKLPNFAYVVYFNSEDFLATSSTAVDVAVAETEIRKLWNETSKTANSEYPKLGEAYTRDWFVEKGGDMAASMFDMLAEGGCTPWPNARAVFTKRGDTMVVTSTI